MTRRHFSEADLPSGEGESRAVHLAFINQNLDIGAATAWQGYQTVGRCAIVVVTRWADVRQPWTAGTTPVGIMDRKKALKMLDKINPPARLLRQYDPLQEMVFCFLRTDCSYRVANSGLTPPEAYEAMKGQMADFNFDRCGASRVHRKERKATTWQIRRQSLVLRGRSKQQD